MFHRGTSLWQWGGEVHTQLNPQTPSSWRFPAWLGFVLLESREMAWSPWASPVNEERCCSLREAIFSFSNPTQSHKNSSADAAPTTHSGGMAWLAGQDPPRAGLPWREETNYLFSASSLSFTWETHFYFPHLYIRRKHLSGSYFFIWVMNFYFLAFSETPVFTVSRLSINTALFQTIFLSASRKGKKKSLYCLSWLLDSHSPGLVNSILSNPWKCFFVLSFTLRIL